jgi:o-succinylbenzoate---CoA ligase
MSCLLASAARYFPKHTALIDRNLTLSFSELDRHVLAFCSALKEIEDERIAFLAHPTLDTITLIFALLRLGKTACPLNPASPELLIQKQLEDLDACFIDPTHLDPKRPSFDSGRSFPSDRTAFLLFTSGTTSTPKIAALSFKNFLYSALGTNPPLMLDLESRYLLTLPLHHVGGISVLFRCLLAKAALVLSQKNLSDEIPNYGITHLSLVPTQLGRLLEKPLSSHKLRSLLLGGGPLSPPLTDLPILASYGMTEMSSTISINGKPLLHREITLSETGEILVKGPTLFQGYWSKKGLELPLTSDGFFPTRDRGEITPSGELKILGRLDNLFISGGENIQPEEIEAHLLSLPEILEAIVLPTPHPEFGQRPTAYVSLKNKSIAPSEILEKLKKVLPKFKVPDQILPLNEGIKPRKKISD